MVEIKIAVDVALLPPEDIMDMVIELNKKFVPDTELNKTDNFPHITLAMGVVDEEQIPVLNSRLKDIASRFNALDLVLEDAYFIIKPDGKKGWSFRVSKTDKLVELHKTVMKELLPLFSYDVDEGMLYKEEINPLSLIWIRNFAKNHKDAGNYLPHISIKCQNDVVYDKKLVKFRASKLGVFHLGDYCTCRTPFGMFELK